MSSLALTVGYLLPQTRREQNPSEAEISSHSAASLRSRFSAKGDKNSYFLSFMSVGFPSMLNSGFSLENKKPIR